jgi:hypothetical protein
LSDIPVGRQVPVDGHQDIVLYEYMIRLQRIYNF